jgi:hypothetical protein
VRLRPAGPDDLPALQFLARSPAVAPFLSVIAADQLAAGLTSDGEEVLVAEVDGRLAGGAHPVQAEVLGHDEVALRAFESAGSTREGVRRKAWMRDDVGWSDSVLVGLLDDEL